MYRATLLPAFILLVLASSATGQEVERSGNIFHKAVCGLAVGHTARCHSHVITDAAGHAIGNARAPVGGYSPNQLRDAYKVTATGSGSTIIAIVDAYGYTNAEVDLKIYRRHLGLPACTLKNGCFKKFNQNGKQKDYPLEPGAVQGATGSSFQVVYSRLESTPRDNTSCHTGMEACAVLRPKAAAHSPASSA